MRSWLAAVLVAVPAFAEPQSSGLPALKEDLAAEVADRVATDVAIASRIAAEETRARAAEQQLRLDVDGVVAQVAAAPAGWLLADGEGNVLGSLMSFQLLGERDPSAPQHSGYLVARQDGAEWSFWTIGASAYAAQHGALGGAAVRAPEAGEARWRSMDCTGEPLLGWREDVDAAIPTGLVVSIRGLPGHHRVGDAVAGATAVSWYVDAGDGTRTCHWRDAAVVRPLTPAALPDVFFTESGFLKAPLAIVPR